MRPQNLVSLAALIALSLPVTSTSVGAQMPNQMSAGNPGVGMILLPVERGTDGQQYITTRAGYKLAIPGVGISPDATQIATFQDAKNNFWYVNKNGQPTPVSQEQMQNFMGQMQQQQMMRQSGYGMPQGGYPQQQPMQQAAPAAAAPVAAAPAAAPSSGSGNSALISGLSAAGGAALGAGVVNAFNNNNNQYPYGSYGGVPYGQPIYKAPTGQYYYNNPSGAQTAVVPTSSTSQYFNQYEQQQAAQQQQRQQAASQAYSTNQSNQQEQQQKAAAAYAANQGNQQQQRQMNPQEAAAAGSNAEQSGGRRRRSRRGDDAQASGQQLQQAAGQESGEDGDVFVTPIMDKRADNCNKHPDKHLAEDGRAPLATRIWAPAVAADC